MLSKVITIIITITLIAYISTQLILPALSENVNILNESNASTLNTLSSVLPVFPNFYFLELAVILIGLIFAIAIISLIFLPLPLSNAESYESYEDDKSVKVTSKTTYIKPTTDKEQIAPEIEESYYKDKKSKFEKKSKFD